VTDHTRSRAELKQKVRLEIKEFLIIFLYLVLMLGAFSTYRMLLMAEYHIGHFIFGYTLIEALILAKIVVLGESLGIGERFGDRPLIIPTLYQTMLFALCVLAFTIPEHLIKGCLHGQGLGEIFQELIGNRYETLARVLTMFVAFIPFFALRETGRALGETRIFDLFFRRRGTGRDV